MCIEDVLEALGHPGNENVFAEESCAFRGMDYTYRFGSIEISTFSPDGTANHVLGIKLVDDSVTTGNGVYMYMARDEVTERYGNPTERVSDNRYKYLKGGMSLEFLFNENDDVIEIFYHYDNSEIYQIAV
jgi:hypothetical protein